MKIRQQYQSILKYWSGGGLHVRVSLVLDKCDVKFGSKLGITDVIVKAYRGKMMQKMEAGRETVSSEYP